MGPASILTNNRLAVGDTDTESKLKLKCKCVDTYIMLWWVDQMGIADSFRLPHTKNVWIAAVLLIQHLSEVFQLAIMNCRQNQH